MYVTANNIPWITEIYEEKVYLNSNIKIDSRFLTQENLPASKTPWGTLSAPNRIIEKSFASSFWKL